MKEGLSNKIDTPEVKRRQNQGYLFATKSEKELSGIRRRLLPWKISMSSEEKIKTKQNNTVEESEAEDCYLGNDLTEGTLLKKIY